MSEWELGRVASALPVVEEHPFAVSRKTRLTGSIVELDLRPLEDRLRFRPGQYVLLSDAEGAVPQRSFSVANAPRADGRLRLLVTRVEGGSTSTWVHDDLVPGATVLVSGAYGTFTQPLPPARPVLHLAAGSGLAPILSLTEAALSCAPRSRITVFFSARTGADLLKVEQLNAWSARHPGFRFLRALTREAGAPPTGRIPALLPGLFPDLREPEVFIAGGGGFVDACEQAVLGLGVPRVRLHTEPFFCEPRPWTGARGEEP